MILSVLRQVASAQVECFQGVACDTGLPTVQAGQNSLTVAMQITFGIIGGVAVVIIMIAAMSMIAAQGEPQKIAKARQTVIFAAVGLAIAVSAEAIVTFVIGKL
ncbi:MAG: hypothetical protein ABWY71_00420 [Candidatus Saccharimonadales bacterium]